MELGQGEEVSLTMETAGMRALQVPETERSLEYNKLREKYNKLREKMARDEAGEQGRPQEAMGSSSRLHSPVPGTWKTLNKYVGKK